MKINLEGAITPKEAHFDKPEDGYPHPRLEDEGLVEKGLRLREKKGEVVREETDDALTFRENGKVIFHRDKKAIGKIVSTERAIREEIMRREQENVGHPYPQDADDILLEPAHGEETGRGS